MRPSCLCRCSSLSRCIRGGETSFGAQGDRRAPLLGLGVLAVVPALAYAWKTAANGRADLPPEDSYAYVPTV